MRVAIWDLSLPFCRRSSLDRHLPFAGVVVWDGDLPRRSSNRSGRGRERGGVFYRRFWDLGALSRGVQKLLEGT